MIEKPITEKELKSALPDTSKTFRLKGIDGPIEIYRDRFGVPHVLAKTVHDAFFGQGLVTAQDRLWHMDYDRRSAYGRLAEVLGASAVEEDKRMRRFQIGATVGRRLSVRPYLHPGHAGRLRGRGQCVYRKHECAAD